MKKKIILFFSVTGIFLFLTGSSPWEGAAAVAPSGELPETGFFIATNSFPRNSVVDITNIETGRTTRAIVANTLNNSGLLAIVSREAAELIGMRAGSVSRVRMIQPSDPMAYQQFTERLASGIPMVNDPIVEQRMLEELYSGDSYTPPSIPAAPSYITPPASPVDLTNPGFERGYVIDEPEWGGNGRLSIVEVPGFVVEPLEPFTAPLNPSVEIAQPNVIPSSSPVIPEEPVYTAQVNNPAAEIVKEPVIAKTDDPEPLPAEIPAVDPVKYVDKFEPASKEPVAHEKTPVSVESIAPDKIIDIPAAITEKPPEEPQAEIIKDVSTRTEETAAANTVKDVPEYFHEIDEKEIKKDIPIFITADNSRDESIKNVPEYIAESPRDELNKNVPVYLTESPHDELVKNIPEYITESPRDELNKNVPVYLTESPHDELVKNIPEYITESPRDEAVKNLPDWSEPIEIAEVTAETEPIIEEPIEIAEVPEETLETEPVIEDPVEIAEVPEEAPETESIIEEPIEVAEVPEETLENESVIEEPVEIAEIPEETPEIEPVIKEPEIIVEAPPYVLPTQPFVPVQSTPRVMEPTVYDIPLSDIIPGIVSTPPVENRQSAPVISASDIISSIAPAQSAAVTAPPVIISPSQIIPPYEAVIQQPAQPSFSVRTISQLDRGQYYVQLVSLPANQVENTLRQIDQRYNPVIFRDRDNLYRILIGPLNQGESAAILQRFRSIGFNDAFVRFGN